MRPAVLAIYPSAVRIAALLTATALGAAIVRDRAGVNGVLAVAYAF